jgi:hypothetical protein
MTFTKVSDLGRWYMSEETCFKINIMAAIPD